MPQKGVKTPLDRGPSTRITITTYRKTCEIIITGDTTGLEIIADVCDIFHLPEPAYFGVRVKREGNFYWLENDETIRQACGKKWTEVVKVIEFKIRFFPPDLMRITDDNIIHTYFIHIRDEVIKGNMMTDPTTAISLAALILQAESGNYDPVVHDADFIKQADCLSSRYSKDSSAVINNIVSEYQLSKGLSSIEANLMFLERAQKIAECGVEYYTTKDKSGAMFNIGAGHDGIFIKHNKLDNLILFKWVNIVTMRYDQKFLWLEVENKKPSTFEMVNKEVARIIFTAFIAQHNFKLGRRLSPFKTYGEKRSIKSKSSNEDDQDSRTGSIPATPPTKRTLLTANGSPSKTDLRNHLLKMLTTPEEIRMEYLGIEKTKPEGTHIAANLPHNKPTNRFRDIVPYDDTRVRLKGERDYINASLISLDSAPHKYILCQGPKENTVGDFWSMVWDQGVTVIAMVTQLREGYKAKCHQYWPTEEGGVLELGDLRVKLSFDRDDVLYVTRGFNIHHIPSERSMDVIHLQFTSWPDHGVPKSPKDLLDYLDEIQSLVKEIRAPFEGAVPLLIHCSAGVGRSGVLLMADLLTRTFNNNELVDIPGTLRKLRNCRSHVVQTEEQYLFIYTALLSYIDQSRLI